MEDFRPIQPGIPAKQHKNVLYEEFYSQDNTLVYCFWSLKTQATLKEDFDYLIVPDACVDIIFDLSKNPDFTAALVMTPQLKAFGINLGKSFSYLGIRLKPGAWKLNLNTSSQGTEYHQIKDCDLGEIRQQLVAASSTEKLDILQNLVRKLTEYQVISSPPADLKLSKRQTQRVFNKNFGYSPRDYRKIMRFQRALNDGNFTDYSDQSHYIREFKQITKTSPGKFLSAYPRMSDLFNTQTKL